MKFLLKYILRVNGCFMNCGKSRCDINFWFIFIFILLENDVNIDDLMNER